MELPEKNHASTGGDPRSPRFDWMTIAAIVLFFLMLVAVLLNEI